MTIKRVLTIKDENYNEEFEVFNKIIIIDEFEVAQKCLEEVAITIKMKLVMLIENN